MKSRPFSILVVLVLFVSIAVPLAIARGGLVQPAPVASPFAAGRLLVKFQPSATQEIVQATFAQEALTLERRLAGMDVYVVSAPAGQELATASRLKRLPAVRYAEPDYVYRANRVPNDPYYASDQWNLPQINAPAAWDVTTGSISVTIAILDTGVDLGHPDLSSKIVAGYDFVNSDSTAQDDQGHGTHVAGIAAALSDNATGVAGVSWGARIMPVKVLDDEGSGTVSDIAEAIHWAADHGAAIISMSLGGTGASSAMQEAINYAYGRGVLTVAAAGNEYGYGNPTVYPAAFPHVIAVAATNDQDRHAAYSNTGFYVDIAAPGGDPSSASDPNPRHWIMSTYLRMAAVGAESVQAAYERMAGTSMATPHVAGLAALVWSRHPNWTNDQIEWAIESSARDLGDDGRDDVFGWGRIDAGAAVALGELPPTPTATPNTCLAESPHPYPNNANQTWTVTNPDASALYSRVHFTRLDMESCCDSLTLSDGAGNETQRVTGSRGGFWSSPIPGGTIGLLLRSDSSVTGWGFCINQVETTPPPAWVIRAPLALPRSRLAVAAAEGKLYAIGGESAGAIASKLSDATRAEAAPVPPVAGIEATSADALTGVQEYSGRAEEYDPATNTWTTKARMPTPLSNLTAATIGGKIYVPGGWDTAPSSLLQIYDPATDSWSAGAALPVALTGAAAAALNDQLYVLGGGTSSSSVNTCYRYDPATNRWAQCASMHTARAFPAAGVVGGKLYAAGGIDYSAGELDSVEEYDPATDRWTTRAPMTTPRGGPGAFGAGDYLYVVGGGWTSFLNTTERYDPILDRWEALDSMNAGRRTLGLAELDGKLYAVGGYTGSFSGQNEAYTLPRILQPALRLAPTAFNITLPTGEATTRTLTIRNAGQMTLTFDIHDVESRAALMALRQTSQTSEVSEDFGSLPAAGSAVVKTGPDFGEANRQFAPQPSAAQETTVSHGLVATTTVRLLVVSPDRDISDLLALLNAYPDVQATRYAGPAAPTLADLAGYDVALTSNNRMWAAGGINPDALGDALAAYVDNGGRLLVANYAYDFGEWAVGGRFARAGYGPFVRATNDLNRPVQLGATLTGHPILQGVTRLVETAIHQNVTLATGAALVASWSDDTPLVAARAAIVGLNLLPSLGDGTHRWSGDAPALIHNAIVWLAGVTTGPDAAWLSVTPAAGQVAPGGQARSIVTFDATNLPVGSYTATLILTSNDPAKSLQQLPVALQVVPPPPEIEVSPAALSARVSPGGVTARRIVIHNSGRGELTYAITETLRPTQTVPTPIISTPTSPASTAAPPAPTAAPLPTRVPSRTPTPTPTLGGLGREAIEPKPAGTVVEPAGVTGPARGGPDPFGYIYVTSAEAGGPTYRWIEIAPPAGGRGVEITDLTGRDDALFWPLSLPFDFDFYGTVYSQIAVQSNGPVSFEDRYLGLGNTPIPGPNTYGVTRFIAPFWDDLVISPGAVYYLAEPDRLIIEYYRVSGCCLSPEPATWEVILYRNGSILYQYQDVSFGNGRSRGGEATVGIQGSTSVGLQFSFNSASLSDGLAICFAYPGQPASCAATTGVPWLAAEPLAGVVPPGGSAIVNVALGSPDLDLGVYGANLVITSNDSDEGKLLVPVTLTVTTTPGEAILSLTPAEVRVEPGQSFTLTLRLASGQQPVDAVDAVLSFDPSRLRAVDETGADAVAIAASDAFPLILQNRVSNTDGQIIFSAGRRPDQIAPAGGMTLGTIRFVAVTETLTSGTLVRFLPTSDVFYGGESVLLAANPSLITALHPFIAGRVTLQGRGSAPSARWAGYPVRLSLYAVGASTPITTFETSLDANGVFIATNVAAGVYDVVVKNSHTLSNRREGVTTGAVRAQEFGALLEGDATDDDRVAGDDFSVVVTAYGAAVGQPGWDARADFNGDDLVGGMDLSLLLTNYGRRGAIGERENGRMGEWGSGGAPSWSPATGVALRLNPPASAVKAGELFTVDLLLETGDQGLDSVDAYLSFDPARLAVVDATGNPATGIVPGDGLPLVLQNQADNGAGRIWFSAGRQPGGALPAGSLRVATIRFRPRSVTAVTGTVIGFAADTGVFSRGQAVSITLADGRVNVTAGGAGYLPLIGR